MQHVIYFDPCYNAEIALHCLGFDSGYSYMLFDGRTAWFSSSTDPEIVDLWKSNGGTLTSSSPQYIFCVGRQDLEIQGCVRKENIHNTVNKMPDECTLDCMSKL